MASQVRDSVLDLHYYKDEDGHGVKEQTPRVKQEQQLAPRKTPWHLGHASNRRPLAHGRLPAHNGDAAGRRLREPPGSVYVHNIERKYHLLKFCQKYILAYIQWSVL